ncbi:MAG: amidohydrolase family protein [Armatimonadetes bacterium]|nr:amidohydrolase family protein [Armatimonadota bacterium]
MVIDSHHHFWRFDTTEYPWISEAMPILRRDYLPADLAAEAAAAGVDGVISVQARQSLAETDWLLELAAEHPLIRGVVGWLPLAAPGIADLLAEYAVRPGLAGLRHVIQDEPDPEFMLGAAFNRGLGQLERHGLVYDLLIYERQLPAALHLVDRHPSQVFVVDHLAKPRIAAAELEPWRSRLREIARRPNVVCKLSGVVTEADHARWRPEQLRPYVETALEAFGPARLMFGSDWPVCRLACEYGRWRELVDQFLGGCTAAERAAVMGGTAATVYGC